MKKAIFLLLVFGLVITISAQSQNVGIGTNTPTHPLTVVTNNDNGIMLQKENVRTGLFNSLFQNGYGFLTTFSSHPLCLSASQMPPAIIIGTNGNVGIGTGYSTPISHQLYVQGNAKIFGKLESSTYEVGTITSIEVNTDRIKVGEQGTLTDRIVHGVHSAGASGSGQLTTTITFPNAFANIPKLFASVRHEPGWNVSDAFAITIKSVSTTQAVLLIRRLDASLPWNQSLKVDWMAVD